MTRRRNTRSARRLRRDGSSTAPPCPKHDELNGASEILSTVSKQCDPSLSVVTCHWRPFGAVGRRPTCTHGPVNHGHRGRAELRAPIVHVGARAMRKVVANVIPRSATHEVAMEVRGGGPRLQTNDVASLRGGLGQCVTAQHSRGVGPMSTFGSSGTETHRSWVFPRRGPVVPRPCPVQSSDRGPGFLPGGMPVRRDHSRRPGGAGGVPG